MSFSSYIYIFELIVNSSVFPLSYNIICGIFFCFQVARDKAVVGWKFTEDIEVPENGFGSGYPGGMD